MAVVIVLVTIISVISNMFLRWSFWGGDRDSDNNRGGNGVFMLIGLVAALVAPIVATLLQLAISRKREYLADASGALLTRYPAGLAGALAKIGSYSRPMRKASTATAHLFFSSPFKGRTAGIASLFSTHPPVEDRIKRLQEMEVKA
jgi:heat shock protein HtpX